jgi:channel protein (hemolysin III family)
MVHVFVTIAGALVFATFVFVSLFRYLKPEKVASDYNRCNGGWHEARLNGCEQGLLKVPQQPINTYTNLAYLAAGLYVQLTIGTVPAFVFALTMTYLCVGSTLYHATSTGWAGILDVTGIYTVFGGTAVYAFATMLGEGHDPLVPTGMFVLAGGLTFIFSPRITRHMEWVIAVLLGSTYLMLVIRMAIKGVWTPLPLLLFSIGLFAIGFGSWKLDRHGKFPFAWGHGVWHLFTAAASAVAFEVIHRTVTLT